MSVSRERLRQLTYICIWGDFTGETSITSVYSKGELHERCMRVGDNRYKIVTGETKRESSIGNHPSCETCQRPSTN